MSLALYRLLSVLAVPLLRLWLMRRRGQGKEDKSRGGERRGRPGRARPPGRLIWIHGASVGESLAVLALIERLVRRDKKMHVLVTTGTVTSAALMAARLPKGAFHQYAPLDALPWVRRFLGHWRPDAAIWVESELWPNLLTETRRRGIPTSLVNGRMSETSHRGWRRWRGMAGKLLDGFSPCLAQSEADGARLSDLGARDVQCLGNLKFAAAPLPPDEAGLARLRTVTFGRRLWLAASTHPGEESSVALAHRRLKESFPTLLTIVAPRHPERGEKIAAGLRDIGFSVARRGAGEPIAAETDIYLADTMGELGLFYRLAGIVFVGGSLVPHGGQNPIEPARLDCAVLYGPHMDNFGPATAALEKARADERVADPDTLADAVARLMRDTSLRKSRARAARLVAETEGTGILDAIESALDPMLARPDKAHARA